MYAYAKNNFYPFDLRESYEAAGTWPESFVEVEDEVFGMYSGLPPEGKMRGADAEGKPVWVDASPPTEQEIIAASEREKNSKIQSVNNYINNKQWPGKAAIGRLKGNDLAYYNAWLDYLDALDAIDTSSAPGIEWPTPPASPAS